MGKPTFSLARRFFRDICLFVLFLSPRATAGAGIVLLAREPLRRQEVSLDREN